MQSTTNGNNFCSLYGSIERVNGQIRTKFPNVHVILESIPRLNLGVMIYYYVLCDICPRIHLFCPSLLHLENNRENGKKSQSYFSQCFPVSPTVKNLRYVYIILFYGTFHYQESDLRGLIGKEKSDEEVFFLVVEGHLHQVGVLVRRAHEPVARVQLPLDPLALHVCRSHKHRAENEQFFRPRCQSHCLICSTHFRGKDDT